ncbi:MAG: sigma 54-interacting transcriptional regulator [candidate division Zixibacteria bacterium]|nr:sigma 54-interacting transcriptional regulator [candidate division Zixibacteria bacterium]
MSIIINELVRLTEADQGVINLISSDEQSKGRTIVRTKLHDPDEIPFHASEQISGWVLRNQTVLLIKDMKSDVRFRDLSLDSDEFTSLICAPMIVRGDVVGITSLVRQDERGSFNENHVRLAGIISSQSAQILSNALLLEELAKNNELLEESHRQLEKENVRLADVISAGFSFEGIIGHSRAIRQVLTLASKVCGNDSPVLIMGATGTGKDLIARAIHYTGQRASHPFITINCGAIPETLMEDELFGHVRGAYTDAHCDKKGVFEESDGGTLFFDEIGELYPSSQVKLLRVFQEREIRRLGETRNRQVDVRIIAATNKDLEQEIGRQRFREDLFHRINVMPIQLPPLRERLDDLPLLVDHFVRESNRIEDIHRDPSPVEMIAHMVLLKLPRVHTIDLEQFVEKIQPGARLRREAGMDVQVGDHTPPVGGPWIAKHLEELLAWGGDLHTERHLIWEFHLHYERLHPFTDGNGRSGRALWLRQVGGAAPLGFLHSFYYMTLAEGDK